MSALEACRLIATQIWRADRDSDGFSLHGLNTAEAVQERLRRIAEALGQPNVAAAEEVVARELSGEYEAIEDLLADRSPRTELLVRWHVTRHVASELDGPVARGLYARLEPAAWTQYRVLAESAQWLFAEGRYSEAIDPALRADRLVRTPSTLIIAAAALANEQSYEAALWAARAALLEPKTSFDPAWPREMAQRLQRRLRPTVEESGDAQLGVERTAVEWVEPSFLEEPTDVTFLTEEDTAESVPSIPT